MRNEGHHRQIPKKNLTVPLFLAATVENSSLNVNISGEFTQRGCLSMKAAGVRHSYISG